MLNWNKIVDRLIHDDRRYEDLKATFEDFSQTACGQMVSNRFQVGHIVAEARENNFTTKFAGRTLTFAFTAVSKEDGPLIGHVHCYMQRDFPETLHELIGQFTFDPKGKTNLIETNGTDSDPYYINSDGASTVVLNFIAISLGK